MGAMYRKMHTTIIKLKFYSITTGIMNKKHNIKRPNF